MDANKQAIIEKRIQKTIAALEKNRMRGYYARNAAELYTIIDKLTEHDSFVATGGSMTLEQAGVIKHLTEFKGSAFRNRADCKGDAEIQKYFRDAFSCDTFLASSNAITENGELYNVDGTGNRVSAMIFGPKQVIIVAGYNKIVPNLDAAKVRVQKLAAPTNAVRLCQNTPCAAAGECMNCHSHDRICCSYVTLAQQRIPDRIKVILLPVTLGY